MATETAAGCTRADLVKCGDTECLCNSYNFDVHGQEPALPAGYFLVVARNPGATAEARASGLATPQPHSCAAIKTADKCTSDGDIYLGTTIFFPQLLSGLFYCWLLSAYIKKKRAGLLAVNEDGSVPAAKPP